MSNVPTTLILLLDSSYRGWLPRFARECVRRLILRGGEGSTCGY